MSSSRGFHQSQRGAALLAFMLVLIISSTYYLVVKLNANTLIATGEQETREALHKAKQALIGYAVSYPDQINAAEGPGYLPCPDTDKNGISGAGPISSPCSFPDTTIGRLPYKTLELDELRDSSGQQLWYAISENFRNNPKLVPLNSESPASADLSINGTGDVVAVIIAPGEPLNSQNRDPAEIDHLAEIANYLDGDNADQDNDFISTLGSSYSQHIDGERDPGANDVLVFNDAVAVITRGELMRAVEKRVLGEVDRILTTYRSNYGVFPWLTPYADPKTKPVRVTGIHRGENDFGILLDNTTDFIALGVNVGDEVRNITDGSIATVSMVNATLLFFSSIELGIENDFDQDDEYVVNASTISDAYNGTADAGSSGNTLIDTAVDFGLIGISGGDIVENINDGSSGMVESVDASDQLTVKTLTGGATNTFSSDDSYFIRINAGQSTGIIDNDALQDANKDFQLMGVRTGDLVVNHTDRSHGRINSVAANTLSVDDLHFGINNVFSAGGYYSFPRFKTDGNTREGLLSFHQAGDFFPTAFSIDFGINAAGGDVSFDTASFPSADAGYQTALEDHLVDYANSGLRSYALERSACFWLIEPIVDCKASFDDHVNISGRVTSGNNTDVVTDNNADFTTDGVKRGDIVQNFDDESLVTSGTADADSNGTVLYDASADFSVYEPYSHVVQNDTQEAGTGEVKIQGNISKIIDANTIEVEPYLGEGTVDIEFNPGDDYTIYLPRKMVVRDVNSSTSLDSTKIEAANPDFDTGEYYRVIPASTIFDGIVDSIGTCSASNTCQINDADGDFINRGVAAGDIIENRSDVPESFGVITNVTATSITTELYEGSSNIFNPGEDYRIYYNHVYFRRHEVQPRFRGNSAVRNSSGVRVRDVCLGYDATCSAVSGSVNFDGNGGVPLVTVRDYKEDGETEVGRATFTPSAASSGTLRVSDIDYLLADNNGDIPEWFLKNNWYQLVYIGESAGDVPGGSGCTPGVDCLVYRQDDDNDPTSDTNGNLQDDNTVRAVVVIAGEEIESNLDTACNLVNPGDPSDTDAQDRSTADMNDYYETENCSPGDDLYERPSGMSISNDQTRIIE